MERTEGVDPFYLDNVYPEAASVFSFRQSPVEEAIGSAIVVLDTNVLLLPYDVGTSSLETIGSAYLKLASEKRLVIPGRVAREFAASRATKLSELFKQIADHRSRASFVRLDSYRMLEGLAPFQRLRKLEDQLIELSRTYQQSLRELTDQVKNWALADPVNELYRTIFDNDVVFDPPLDQTQIKKDLEWRLAHKIPPGYKDVGKLDSGIGDLLIWHTIIELGKLRKCALIFISGEEKSDWQYRSAGGALFPRYELLDEYRRASGGQPFYLLTFSQLLGLSNINQSVVEEVRKEEVELNIARLTEPQTETEAPRPMSDPLVDATDAVIQWWKAAYLNAVINRVAPARFTSITEGEFPFDVGVVFIPALADLEQRLDWMLSVFPAAESTVGVAIKLIIVVVPDYPSLLNALPVLRAKKTAAELANMWAGVLQRGRLEGVMGI